MKLQLMFHYGKIPLDQKWHFWNHRSHCHHNANWSPPSIFGTSSWMSFLSSSASFVIEPGQFWPVLPTILWLFNFTKNSSNWHFICYSNFVWNPFLAFLEPLKPKLFYKVGNTALMSGNLEHHIYPFYHHT